MNDTFQPITSQDQFDRIITARIRRERKAISGMMVRELKEIYKSTDRADMQFKMIQLMDKLGNL